MELKDLVGEHLLTGVDSGILKGDPATYWSSDATTLLFVLDGRTYRVTEDPDDDYRSSMKEIAEVDGALVANHFAPVKVVATMLADNTTYSGDCEILQIRDSVTNKIIIEVGTANMDDYYPYYVGNFTPENMAINSGR